MQTLTAEPFLAQVPGSDAPAYPPERMPGWWWFYGILSLASAGASTFHGYRRHGTVGAAVGWGILGALFPVIVPAVAIAQGFGQRKRG